MTTWKPAENGESEKKMDERHIDIPLREYNLEIGSEPREINTVGQTGGHLETSLGWSVLADSTREH